MFSPLSFTALGPFTAGRLPCRHLPWDPFADPFAAIKVRTAIAPKYLSHRPQPRWHSVVPLGLPGPPRSSLGRSH